VSIDVDCIDQSQAPGTASPNACGIDARDLYLGLRRLAQDSRVVAADIVEISPPLDVNNMTGNVGAMLVLSFLMGVHEGRAKRRSQARPK
jgi:arginase family enzyme